MAKKREFTIPSAERSVKATESPGPAGDCGSDSDDGDHVEVASFEVVLGPAEGRFGRRLDTLLSVAAARGQARIREGLRGKQVRLSNGREPNPNSSADFIKLLLEQAADPKVTRIVFYRSHPDAPGAPERSELSEVTGR
jgi:hypothetical protein